MARAAFGAIPYGQELAMVDTTLENEIKLLRQDLIKRSRFFDEIIDCSVDMAQELQETLDAMREASGDDNDGSHLAALIERWEGLYRNI